MDLFVKMRKSLGNKRNELSKENIDAITRLYGDFRAGEQSKIFDNDDFGYRRDRRGAAAAAELPGLAVSG